MAFSEETSFFECCKDTIAKIQAQFAALLKVLIPVEKWRQLSCGDMQIHVFTDSWFNSMSELRINPTEKLAHYEEMIPESNSMLGMKEFSGEVIELSNKLIRNFENSRHSMRC